MSESVRESSKKPEAVKEERRSQVRRADCSVRANSSFDHILFLQRTIGNQAVQRLIKSGIPQAKLYIRQHGEDFEQHETNRNISTSFIQRQNFPEMTSIPQQGDNPARTRRLQELLTQINTQTSTNLGIRGELDRLLPASSERTNIEDKLNNSRSFLINLLQQRVTLLNEEIESLNVRIGPNPVSSPGHPEMDSLGHELLKKEQERRQHEEQLKPLRQWQMRREIGSINDQIAEIDREISTIPLVCDPLNPTAELLTLRRSDLERRKRELVKSLTSTATEFKQFDPRWGGIRYGQSPACTNIKAAGCGPTSLAILLNYLYQEDPEGLASSGQMEIVTPPETAGYAATHGRVCNNGTAGDVMVTNVHTEWPGFKGNRVSLGEATNQLRNGNLIIFLCKSCAGQNRSGGNKSYGGHYMVLNGVNENGTVYNVLDPGAGETTDIETISRLELQSHSSGFWIINRK